MRGTSDLQLAMLTSLSTEELIPRDHPIRRIKAVVEVVLAELDGVFEGMYSVRGRASVPPETLLKATVLMAMYSIRSERAFCERLNYDLLFRWFLDMRIDQPAFDATTFTKNRTRLLDHEVADEFFAAVVRQAKLRCYVSSDHFSVDGTLLNAWASHKSFKPKDRPPPAGSAGRNAGVQWHGEKRSNDTHASTTDPESRLHRKSNNTAATLCYSGHLLMENRNALIVDAELATADGYAERATALEMLARLPASARRRTVAGDKGYDTRGFIAETRELGFTPHVAPNTSGHRRSAIDGRTTRHAGHAVSKVAIRRVIEPLDAHDDGSIAASTVPPLRFRVQNPQRATEPASASRLGDVPRERTRRTRADVAPDSALCRHRNNADCSEVVIVPR